MKIGVLCVPFFTCESHFNSAKGTIESVRSSLTECEIHIRAVVNRCDSAEHMSEFCSLVDSHELNDKNILSRAWNKGIRHLLEDGCRYVLVINLDLVLHPFLIEKLVLLADQFQQAVMWSAEEVDSVEALMQEVPDELRENYANFSCFLIDSKLFEQIGEFDERFVPAYHEDADMRYRMNVAKALHIGLTSAKFLHAGQGTLKAILNEKDEELAMKIRLAMNTSMDRYSEKWGGLPGNETFSVPFGKESSS